MSLVPPIPNGTRLDKLTVIQDAIDYILETVDSKLAGTMLGSWDVTVVTEAKNAALFTHEANLEGMPELTLGIVAQNILRHKMVVGLVLEELGQSR